MPSQRAQRIVWRSCDNPRKELQCARVAVPLDWRRPNDRKIELAVIRHRASRPHERIGSLFFNWGGPGVAGIPKVRDMAVELDAIGGGRFDVVSWDPRGTGESDHIVCFRDAQSRKTFWGRDWSIPTTRAESEKYLPKAIELVRRCTALSGALLAHISTADTVRDLDYLRQLVGDAQLNYRGISYGTFIGQTYANMFARKVRAMVLDGVLDPIAFTGGTAENIASSIADADLVFQKFQSLCQSAGPAGCDLARHGAVSPRVRQLFTRLRHVPIGKLTYGDALIVVWAKLGAPTQWPQLATELNEAAVGNASALEKTAQSVKAFVQPALDSAVGLQCADKPFPPRPRPRAWRNVIGQLTRDSFISGPVNGWLLWAPCAAWPVRSVDRYAGPWNAFTNNRILVIGTRFDPNTAYANAIRTASRLRNAALLTHDGYGHTSDADPSSCVERAVTAYLVRLVTPPTGTACASNRRPFERWRARV
ncbi:MAG: alpha/beta fold hydrolase [Candidatus Eremiobacteraeota bacterium]|nr:alpha/beta fold hydrolase [Candidatus Eremiobacteraeota bacterium]